MAWGEPHWPWEFDTFEHLGVVDWGDICFQYGSPQEMLDLVQAHAAEILAAGKSLLTFGGDHLMICGRLL